MHLKPLPAWIPEVYRLHQRTVDVEGYVSVNSIRYSVPVAWIGHRVEVRETRDKLEIEMDARHIVTHARAVTPLSQRVTLAAHRPPRGEGVKRSDPHPEEKAIVEAAPETALYVAALKQKSRKVVALALRQLLRLLREYGTYASVSARTVPGRGAGSRPVWALRSRPSGANDFAPRGA